MASEELYCVGDVCHGSPHGLKFYEHGERFPTELATDEQIATLCKIGSLKTKAELVGALPLSLVVFVCNEQSEKMERLRAQLRAANVNPDNE